MENGRNGEQQTESHSVHSGCDILGHAPRPVQQHVGGDHARHRTNSMREHISYVLDLKLIIVQ